MWVHSLEDRIGGRPNDYEPDRRLCRVGTPGWRALLSMVGDEDESATTMMTTKEKSAADMARPTLGSGAVRCVDSETGREGPRGTTTKTTT